MKKSFFTSNDHEIRISIDPKLLDEARPKLNDNFNDYYAPPADWDAVTGLFRMAPPHEQSVYKKKTLCLGVMQCLKKEILSEEELEKIVLDYILFGNFYCEMVDGKLRHRNARIVRKTKKGFVKVVGGVIDDDIKFDPEMIHGKNYCPESSIYGLPEYLSAVIDILANHGARTRRCVIYHNGTEGGVLMTNIPVDYTVNEETNEEEPDEGFKSLVQHVQKTKKGGAGSTVLYNVNDPDVSDLSKLVHWVPLKTPLKDDEYETTLNQTRISIFNAHGIHPEVMAVLIQERASSPNLEKLIALTYETVINPLADEIARKLNESGENLIEVVPPKNLKFEERP